MRIKEVLKEKNLTQQELANEMGVSLSAVKQMVNATSLTTATLVKIANVLDVPMWQLLVSPKDVAKVEVPIFFAMFHADGQTYTAATIAEAEDILAKIKGRVTGE